MRPAEHSDRPTGVSRGKTAVICVVILLAAAGVAALTFFSEPTARRSGATRETAMLVEVVPAERGTYRPTIVATGVVQAEQDIVLRPQVSGKVVWRSPELTPGGFVPKGKPLLRIEAADYNNVLRQRRSDLRQALAGLQIEQGRQQAARSGYRLLDRPLPTGSKELVLRQPQLDAARVRVEAARAAVAQARLDLRRTTIRAPFAAQIIRRDVNLGSQVAVGDAMARLVGVEHYWVQVSVPLPRLRWLSFPGGGAPPSPVRVRNRAAWPPGAYRDGELHRLIGALDEQTRLARVLVTIPDPLGRRADDGQRKPPLMVGEFVEVRITGKPIPDVVRLDRDHVRAGDTAWVMDNGRLRIRRLGVVMRDARHAYVSAGLDPGDRVVTTSLATVTDGARLRLEPAGNNKNEKQATRAGR